MLIIYYQKMSNKYWKNKSRKNKSQKNKSWKISTNFLKNVNSYIKNQLCKIPTYYLTQYDNCITMYNSSSSIKQIFLRMMYGGLGGTVIGFTYASYYINIITHKKPIDNYDCGMILSCLSGLGGLGGSFVGLTYQLIPVYIGLYAIDKTFKIYGKIKRC
jgi:hypothetical protein